MKKSAYAILKKGNVHVQAYAEITAGFYRAYGPIFTCSVSDEAQIAQNVRKAFEYSIQGVPQPSREGWKEVQRPMLEAVGAKTWDGLAKGARAIGLVLDQAIVKIEPSLNYWDRGGVGLPDQAIFVPNDTPDLGKFIVRAFELSS